jgi:hypothetical protein
MDADDVNLPDRIEAQFRRFEIDPALRVLGTGEARIDETGKSRGRAPVVTGCDAVTTALARRCVVRHSSVMMRRQPIVELGGYRPAYLHAEDYDLWLRVGERGKVDNLEHVGIKYRMHSTSVSERHTARQRVSGRSRRRRTSGALRDLTIRRRHSRPPQNFGRSRCSMSSFRITSGSFA